MRTRRNLGRLGAENYGVRINPTAPLRPGLALAPPPALAAAPAAPSGPQGIDLATRRRNIAALRALGERLQKERMPGVRLWAKLTETAAQAYPGLGPRDRADLVMQDLAGALLANDAIKFLEQYRG